MQDMNGILFVAVEMDGMDGILVTSGSIIGNVAVE